MGFILSPRVEVLHWYNENMLVVKEAKEYKLNVPQALTFLKAIKGDELSTNELNFINRMIDIGLILKNDKSGQHIIITGEKNKRYPLELTIELTNRCNLFCSHCYASANEKSNKDIDIDIYYNIINNMCGKVHKIHLTGGEPLIHESAEKIIYETCKQFKTEISTNALLIENIKSILGKINPFISVSLYGLSDEEYRVKTGNSTGFRQLCRSLDILADFKKEYLLNVILTKENYVKLPEFYKFAFEKGAYGVQIGIASRVGRANDNSDYWMLTQEEIRYAYRQMRLLEQQYKGKLKTLEWQRENMLRKYNNKVDSSVIPCGAGIYNWTIDECGFVRPCCMMDREAFRMMDLREFYEYIDNKLEPDWQKVLSMCRDMPSRGSDICEALAMWTKHYEH